ncbi:CaiB/BaiF CoA transferase family protein [Achromobacter piechaudii]|uniref:Acetyl-CoA:oxalate CoA-transferase n=1 Tax=Achromobacter piechaudii TaxID=72556 RepID=A0A6S7CWH9_9BURK|nr:CoA transferase [Achromobacter piechaudii]CAB3867866.1 Acetyl-CoA:oxalate CoA-transferase [Achromobacter piechaudii]
MTTKPLTGVRVLDFSKTLAGPLCTQSLADLGADVIKIEPLGLGDETRAWPPFRAEGLGAVFLSVNRNKRSLALDLKTEGGRQVAHALARQADVAIESFATGVAERLAIDAGTLRGLNERLIHCSISGFGRDGPLKDLGGYDVILQAFSGMMSLTGEEGGGYIRSPISPVDQMTGTHALTGILAALLQRQQTGIGSTVQVSLFETALALLRYNLQSFWERGEQPPRCGSTHEALCPYRAFEASDGPIMLGVANDNLWRKFCGVAGLDSIVDHPDFRSNPQRAANREATERVVQDAIATRTVAFWNDELAKMGVPCAPINTLRQVVDHPHTDASGLIVDYDHPHGGPIRSVGQPFILDGQPRLAGTPPPLHGEHTEDILRELGLSAQQIESLRAARAIA